MSVGFSSWTISVGYTAQAELNLTVDRVVDINNYFEFAGEAKYFKYTSEGIAKDDVLDPSVAQVGDIEIPFQINVGKGSISKHLPEGLNLLTLQTVLIDTNTKNGNFFSYCSYTATLYKNTKTPSNLNDENKITVSNIELVNNKELAADFTITGADLNFIAGTNYYFVVKYTLTFSTANNLSQYQNAYNSCADNGQFKFSFKAGALI